MKLERTNLLPSSRIRSSHRNYFIRLGIVSLLALAALVLIHAVFLLPAYIYLNQKVSVESMELARLMHDLTQNGEQNVQSKLETLQAEADSLEKLQHASSASGSIRAVLAVSHADIKLTGFTYTAPADATDGTLQVSGIASTRESLRNYAQTLGALPFVKNTDLPISVYAQDSNIPFTITLTGTLSS